MNKPNKKAVQPSATGLSHNPFAALASALPKVAIAGDDVAVLVPTPVPGLVPGTAAAKRPDSSAPARAAVRMERKGRGGKVVTVVEQLGLNADGLDVWLKDLKTALGTGGTVEGDVLVIQGDQRDRLKELLLARGVGKVSVG